MEEIKTTIESFKNEVENFKPANEQPLYKAILNLENPDFTSLEISRHLNSAVGTLSALDLERYDFLTDPTNPINKILEEKHNIKIESLFAIRKAFIDSEILNMVKHFYTSGSAVFQAIIGFRSNTINVAALFMINIIKSQSEDFIAKQLAILNRPSNRTASLLFEHYGFNLERELDKRKYELAMDKFKRPQALSIRGF